MMRTTGFFTSQKVGKLIDANELLKKQIVMQSDVFCNVPVVTVKAIQDAPEAVVCCGACKNYHKNTGWCDIHSHFIGSEGEACHPWESADWKMFDEDYFCKDGERRNDG